MTTLTPTSTSTSIERIHTCIADEEQYKYQEEEKEEIESSIMEQTETASHCRSTTEASVDDDNDGSDEEDPPSVLAVHPVDIRFLNAQENLDTNHDSSNQSKDTKLVPGTSTTRPWKLDCIPLLLLSMPIDSLHCIASFLNTVDWDSFGRASLGANRVGREIFRRVRMHGFRCATEVVTAWKSGQHSDARELVALYIKAGVPIYPQSLGHSYHTLVWRMGIESREMERSSHLSTPPLSTLENSNIDPNPVRDIHPADQEATERIPIDLFSTERSGEGDSTRTSYLEQKCMFWHNYATGTSARHISLNSRANFTPPVVPMLAIGGGTRRVVRFPGFRPDQSPTRCTTLSETLKQQKLGPKVMVKVHRHLVDQHLMGHLSVDDENGAMTTAPISLAADFFHPQVKAADSRRFHGIAIEHEKPLGLSGSQQMTESEFSATPTQIEFGSSIGDYGAFGDDDGVVRENTSLDELLQPREEDQVVTPQPLMSIGITSPPPPPQFSRLGLSPVRSTVPESIIDIVDLDIYSSGSTNLTTLSYNRELSCALNSHLKSRFAVFHRKLETLLSQSDSNGYEECILDFWDEFLPVTANIHLFDRHTAVPRLSGLQEFMTKPCPKAIGIVQCEIERIKMTSKKKGVNMTGRLFPTYEYRLFIRDRRHSTASEAPILDEQPVRRDTVVMMAKNRGRNHQDLSGVFPAQASSKKGVNNYSLHTPQQVDIDTHFNFVNTNSKSVLNPNGASNITSRVVLEENDPVLLGRLQSNFIGTEFQIFTPTLQKRHMKITPAVCDSENDLDYDSGVSSDTSTPVTASLRRNRFTRRRSTKSRRKGTTRKSIIGSDHHTHPDPIDEGEESDGFSPKSRVRRSYSLPIMGKSPRSSRRAVAHSETPKNAIGATLYHPLLCEEEGGAITYTANLLGNRPRIMDVCVPKVTDDGVAAAQWKRYLESLGEVSDPTSGNRMLTHFKQVQQRLEYPDQNVNTEDEIDAISANDYAPPEDFGLLALQNRPPWWNIELGAFVLNFGGRVSVASVKNFQLCDRSDQDHIMLQFGRIQGRHSFTMDFQFPLTPVQAFAIAISSLQSRISFG